MGTAILRRYVLISAIGQGGVSVVTMPGDIASKAAPEKTVEHALVTSRPTVRYPASTASWAMAFLRSASMTARCAGSCSRRPCG